MEATPTRVLIISDCTDVAYAEMRGAIISNARRIGMSKDPVIEALVPVYPLSVLNASFLVRLMVESYDPDTLIMVVVNSVQHRPERIVGRTKEGYLFEGANTGAFSWLLRDQGVAEVFELHDPGFVPFGGKFVHAPAVGKLLAGADPHDLGTPFPEDRLRNLPDLQGQLVHIDNFGNGKFTGELWASVGDHLDVDLGGERVAAVFADRMMGLQDGTWAVYPGSSLGLLEIGQVRKNGLLQYELSPGDQIRVTTSVQG